MVMRLLFISSNWKKILKNIETVEDAISAIKEQIQGLDEDTEITFKIKNADGEIESFYKSLGVRVGLNARF